MNVLKEEKVRAIELHKLGKSITEISNEISNVSRASIHAWVKAYKDGPKVAQKKKEKEVKYKAIDLSPPPAFAPPVKPLQKKKNIVLICSDDPQQILDVMRGMI